MFNTTLRSLLLAAAVCLAASSRAEMPLITGEVFPDTEGKHINAHGGAIVKDNDTGTYYWFGEHRGSKTDRSPQLGVACYAK